MMGVLIKRGNLYTDTYTWKTPLKDGRIYWGDASTSQGKLRMTSKPPEARGGPGTDSPS